MSLVSLFNTICVFCPSHLNLLINHLYFARLMNSSLCLIKLAIHQLTIYWLTI